MGFLANYKVYYTPVPNIDEEVKGSGKDYQISSLGNYMRNPILLDFLVESYKLKGGDNQMIVFCVDKKHAKAVKDTYERSGYTSIAHIDSDTKLDKRAEILEDFADDKIKIITCIETLTEGVDLPETKCIQLARPTKSLNLYLQMVGRGARPKKDGSDCIILDNAGCTIEHKSPNADRNWSLNPLNNPSNSLRKNKILGRRKDGSFTEDENEMAFLELIEMTDEEYALNIVGGIEKSQEENKKVDAKCVNILKELGEFISKKTKNKNIKVKDITIDGSNINFRRVELSLNDMNFRFETNYSINRIEITTSDYYYDSEYQKKRLWDILKGELTSFLIKGKIEEQILNYFIKIKELQDDKVDINSLKSKKKEFEKAQNQIKVENHLINNNIIEITSKSGISLSLYFRDYYLYGADKMEFSRNKLMATNEIIFHKTEIDRKIKISVKKDKVMDILNDNSWK